MNFTDEDISLILTALKFSADKHRNQRRKDADSLPCINHPILLEGLVDIETLMVSEVKRMNNQDRIQLEIFSDYI